MTASLYQILQVVSVTIFERVPILQALQLQDPQDNSGVFSNQLILLDLWPDSSVRHSPSKTSSLGSYGEGGESTDRRDNGALRVQAEGGGPTARRRSCRVGGGIEAAPSRGAGTGRLLAWMGGS